MARKDKATTNEGVEKTVINDNVNAITSFARADTGEQAPGDTERLNIVIHSDILDRWEGLSATFEVWGREPSLRYLTAALSDTSVRDDVADFFVTRQFATVFKNLLPGLANSARTIQPKDGLLNKSDIHRVLSDQFEAKTSGVIMELVLPLLIDLGLVSGNIKYSRHVRYPFGRVTTNHIQHDVALYQVMQAVKTAKASAIDVNARYTVSVLAELLAETLRPVGLALYEYHDLSSIVDDIISGVRAHLDPTLSGGKLEGSVPSDWRNHPVVAELAQNMVFVRSALAIPPASNLTPLSEGWKLSQWAPTILAALKSSERYAWVSKQEVLRTYGLRKIRNVKGKVVSSVIYRSAKTQPVAQAVFAVEDALLKGDAFSIHPTKDRIADAIQSAYGAANFDTAGGANMLVNLITDGVEAGWKDVRALYTVDTLEHGFDVATVACMLSDRLYVNVSDAGVEVVRQPGAKTKTTDIDDTTWQPKWWFAVKTTELNLDVLSGSHLRSEVVTHDPVEVLLAHAEFEALDTVPVKPQVLGPAAFNTTVIAFDENMLRNVGKRYSFNVTVNEIEMKGAFKPSSFASMRSRDLTSLVLPHFNSSVIYGYASAYATAYEVLAHMERSGRRIEGEGDLAVVMGWSAGSAPADEFFSFMKRRIAKQLLDMAQRLSPAFRQEVHEAIVSRSIARDDLTPTESALLRARLTQRTFAAACDMIALDFFLDTQGIQVDIWRTMLTDAEMVKVWMEVGSDRDLSFM